ncbi:hypothetical protein [Actinomadura terrae]|uniref:hypothetical protein n=1 Tax=Actinomadura terrae TaxID=604353 RepID=UPI001FA77A4B|nr:hypothetical protein [Actinomadura terrae]
MDEAEDGGMDEARSEAYPLRKLGLVAQVNNVPADTWMASRFAAILVGVSPSRLDGWASAGLLSYRQDGPSGPMRYLRAERLIVCGLGVGGEPPTVEAVRRHVRHRKGHGAL